VLGVLGPKANDPILVRIQTLEKVGLPEGVVSRDAVSNRVVLPEGCITAMKRRNIRFRAA